MSIISKSNILPQNYTNELKAIEQEIAKANQKKSQIYAIKNAALLMYQKENNDTIIQGKVNQWLAKNANGRKVEVFLPAKLSGAEKEDASNAEILRRIALVTATTVAFIGAAMIAVTGLIIGSVSLAPILFSGTVGEGALGIIVAGELLSIPAILFTMSVGFSSFALGLIPTDCYRKNTAYNSKLFNEFYNKFAMDRIQKDAIADAGLHRIYEEWKLYSKPVSDKINNLNKEIKAKAEKIMLNGTIVPTGKYILDGLKLPKCWSFIAAISAI